MYVCFWCVLILLDFKSETCNGSAVVKDLNCASLQCSTLLILKKGIQNVVHKYRHPRLQVCLPGKDTSAKQV